MSDQKNNDSDFELEDDNFVEDDWEENENSSPNMSQKKKKSGGLILALGGIVIIGAGAYLAKNILTTDTALPPAAMETAQMSNPYAQDAGPEALDRPEQDMQQAPQDRSMDNMPDMPSPDDSEMAMSNDTPSALSWPGDDMPAPEGNAPEYDSATADSSFAQPDSDAMPPSDMPGMDMTEENDYGFDDADIETISEDEMAASQPAEDSEAMSTEMMDTTSPSPVGTPQADTGMASAAPQRVMDETPETTGDVAANQEIETLNARISELETMLEDMQSRLENQDISSLQNEVSTLNRQIREMQSEAEAAPASAAPTRATSTTPPKPATPSPSTRREAPAAEVSDWVLRSADSGSAWVSEEGSDDMRQIFVGDRLSGLGEVQSIDYNRYQGWVVTGTNGRITQ